MGEGEGVFRTLLKAGYQRVFYENWPTWFAGILLGILSVFCLAWGRPFGIVGGLKEWGDWVFYGIGLYEKRPPQIFVSTNSLMTLGFLWGAFGSALLAKEFAIRIAPGFEMLKGIVGGALMGIGSAMAGGCNIGGFFAATSALSLSGIAMMFGLFMGAYLGLRYLYWELEHIPTGGKSQPEPTSGSGGSNLKAISPYLGFAVLIGALVFAWIYSKEAFTREGVLLLLSVAFGIVIQRARFCFVRGFRDPFMTAEAEIPRGIAIALTISILGFAIIKWAGLRPESTYVPQAFWFGALVGGIIFGFGMVVAGGCGTGSLWRAGEGQVKLMLAVLSLSLTISVTENWINSSKALTQFMGRAVFIPDYIGYRWTVLLLFLFFAAYYLIATWNEKTEKFLVEP